MRDIDERQKLRDICTRETDMRDIQTGKGADTDMRDIQTKKKGHTPQRSASRSSISTSSSCSFGVGV